MGERGVKAILRFLARTPGPQRKILERTSSGKIRSSFFKYVKFEKSTKYPSGDLRRELNINLYSREGQTGILNS